MSAVYFLASMRFVPLHDRFLHVNHFGKQLPYRNLVEFASLLEFDHVRKPLAINIQHYCSSEDTTGGDKSGTASSTTRHNVDAPYYRTIPGLRRFGSNDKSKVWNAAVRRSSCNLNGYPCGGIAWCVSGCPSCSPCRLARGILKRS